MNTDNKVELSPEELEAAGGGFWEEIAEFGKNVWDKVKKTIIRAA